MQQRRRRHRATALTLVIGAITLAGCTVGSASSSGTSGSASGEHNLVIVEWVNPPAITFTNQLDAAFEKAHPGVKVELKSAPTSNNAYDTLLSTQLAAKSADIVADFPDVSTSYPPASTKIAVGGLAAQISSGQFVNLTSESFMKDYDPIVASTEAGYQGKDYGVPAAEYINAGGMWYKPALLAKYHLPVPATYGRFLNELKTLKGDGLTPVFVAGKDGLNDNIYNGIVQQLLMEGEPSSQSPQVAVERATAFWNGTQTWTDALYQQAASEYTQIMKYTEPDAAGVSQLSAPGVWAGAVNNYPFFIDGSWDGQTIQQANPKLDFGMMALPGTSNASANRIPLQGDLTWFVPSAAPDRQLALEWLALFSQKANYQKWLVATGSVSTQPGVSTQSLPWMSWQNQHASTAFALIGPVWTPNGAASDASAVDLTTMQPFGSLTPSQALTASANAYRQSRGK